MTHDLLPADFRCCRRSGVSFRRRRVLFSSSSLTGMMRLALYGAAGMLAAPSLANALPTGGSVSAGAATIATGASTVTITQTSQAAAINWASFDIGKGNSVAFVQPNSGAVILNRVLGSDPSVILGNLTANGKVFLINPNGILFGQGAQVNAGGLVASTLNLSDADFMAGHYAFSGNSGAGVVNHGTLNAADGGYVALLGASVSNQGIISARLGSVALAAGQAVTLDVAGDGLLSVAVDTGAINALVQNGGLIRADGGTVMLTAQAAGQLLRTAVNNSGVIEARTLESRNGTIMLLGDTQSGTVTVSGKLDASGAASGQGGGTIVATANAVSLAGSATLDASGAGGGGTILVGGDYQGTNAAIAHATTVSTGAGTSLLADATVAGNGGKIVLWSEGVTTANGAISARGGARSGNGGLVETSGQQVRTGSTARVSTLAANGTTGLWLLDPVDYVIAINGGDETPSQVTTSLASSNRLIEATHDITVSDAITWTTPQTLELRAGNDVLVNAAMTASTAGSTMLITAGHDVQVNGALTASGNGSLIRLNAGHDIDLAQAVTSSGGGSVLFVADSDGTGGANGGTVHLSTLFPVTSTSKTIYYSPENGYAAPNLYTGFTSYMWVFVAARDKTYDGTVAATATFRGDPTVGGAKDVGLTGGAIAFVDKDVGAAKPVTFSAYSLNGANAALYALYAPSGLTTAAITPAALTVTADGASKVYGQTLGFAGTAFTASGLVAGETIGVVTEVSPGAVATAPVAGSPYAITPSNATGGTFSAANYTINYVNGALTINPATLVVTANNAAKLYGDLISFPGTAFTSAGLQNGDAIGSVTETSPGAAATASVAGAPYAITPSNAVGASFVASNYTITYVDGALTISPAQLIVTASNATKTYGETLMFDGTAFTATGLKNGETITSVTETSPGATSTANVNGGGYAITASNAVGGTYTPANYVTSYVAGTLTVTPAMLSITANNVSKMAGTTYVFDATGFAAIGLKNGDTIDSVTETSPGATNTATVDGSPYAITVSDAVGASFRPANYTISYSSGALTVTPATPPVVTPPVTDPAIAPPATTPPATTPPATTPPGTDPAIAPPATTPVGGAAGSGGLGPNASPVIPNSATQLISTAVAATANSSAPQLLNFAVLGTGVAMPTEQLEAAAGGEAPASDAAARPVANQPITPPVAPVPVHHLPREARN